MADKELRLLPHKISPSWLTKVGLSSCSWTNSIFAVMQRLRNDEAKISGIRTALTYLRNEHFKGHHASWPQHKCNAWLKENYSRTRPTIQGTHIHKHTQKTKYQVACETSLSKVIVKVALRKKMEGSGTKSHLKKPKKAVIKLKDIFRKKERGWAKIT